MFGEWKLTDGGRKVLESIRGETQKQRAFANPRIPNHQKLEQVIEFGVTRRRGRSIHSEPQKWEKQTRCDSINHTWMAIVLDWIWEFFCLIVCLVFLFRLVPCDWNLDLAWVLWKVEAEGKEKGNQGTEYLEGCRKSKKTPFEVCRMLCSGGLFIFFRFSPFGVFLFDLFSIYFFLDFWVSFIHFFFFLFLHLGMGINE